ncbi:hypothetical protein BDK51DRAFT_43879 [Blyttiomyces helicus]|uniref:Uncharacterized protein n=1 Tax=Blyttiomyces helicus TaxID=388810 RepID=A0A4P9WL31_9FUNG|nr:hypothetical protein BDK51DRAFT_43879 [Blyttiomyces helicus]|eukprot:RKO93729.1 hypothetical protein BDK51DRAFT_43879 [Blyttiomyces helicus]
MFNTVADLLPRAPQYAPKSAKGQEWIDVPMFAKINLHITSCPDCQPKERYGLLHPLLFPHTSWEMIGFDAFVMPDHFSLQNTVLRHMVPMDRVDLSRPLQLPEKVMFPFGEALSRTTKKPGGAKTNEPTLPDMLEVLASASTTLSAPGAVVPFTAVFDIKSFAVAGVERQHLGQDNCTTLNLVCPAEIVAEEFLTGQEPQPASDLLSPAPSKQNPSL